MHKKYRDNTEEKGLTQVSSQEREDFLNMCPLAHNIEYELAKMLVNSL